MLRVVGVNLFGGSDATRAIEIFNNVGGDRLCCILGARRVTKDGCHRRDGSIVDSAWGDRVKTHQVWFEVERQAVH